MKQLKAEGKLDQPGQPEVLKLLRSNWWGFEGDHSGVLDNHALLVWLDTGLGATAPSSEAK
jgi:hypothetical protein